MNRPAITTIHEKAICDSGDIGPGTRIWPFAHVLSGAKIGSDCNICESVFVENDVIVGDRVTIKCGVQLWDGVRLANDVFVGPNATFTNDRLPRSKKYQDDIQQTIVERGASIGANATILPGLRIGRSAMVAAGAVVTRDVPAHALVAGNPARIVRFVAQDGSPLPSRLPVGAETLTLPRCRLIKFPVHQDASGTLIAVEHDGGLPFEPRRTFFLRNITPGHVRGNHGHRLCSQAILSLAGAATVMIDDGINREEIIMNDPTVGLYLPPMTWCSIFRFSPDCIMQVYASHPYDNADYIHSYTQFLQLVSERHVD